MLVNMFFWVFYMYCFGFRNSFMMELLFFMIFVCRGGKWSKERLMNSLVFVVLGFENSLLVCIGCVLIRILSKGCDVR